MTTEQLMAELRAVVREAEELLQGAGNQDAERVEELRARAEETLVAARAQLENIDTQVRRNPWAAVGIAAGVGLLLGLLLSRK